MTDQLRVSLSALVEHHDTLKGGYTKHINSNKFSIATILSFELLHIMLRSAVISQALELWIYFYGAWEVPLYFLTWGLSWIPIVIIPFFMFAAITPNTRSKLYRTFMFYVMPVCILLTALIHGVTFVLDIMLYVDIHFDSGARIDVATKVFVLVSIILTSMLILVILCVSIAYLYKWYGRPWSYPSYFVDALAIPVSVVLDFMNVGMSYDADDEYEQAGSADMHRLHTLCMEHESELCAFIQKAVPKGKNGMEVELLSNKQKIT